MTIQCSKLKLEFHLESNDPSGECGIQDSIVAPVAILPNYPQVSNDNIIKVEIDHLPFLKTENLSENEKALTAVKIEAVKEEPIEQPITYEGNNSLKVEDLKLEFDFPAQDQEAKHHKTGAQYSSSSMSCGQKEIIGTWSGNSFHIAKESNVKDTESGHGSTSINLEESKEQTLLNKVRMNYYLDRYVLREPSNERYDMDMRVRIAPFIGKSGMGFTNVTFRIEPEKYVAFEWPNCKVTDCVEDKESTKCHPVERLKSFVAKLHDKYKADLKEEVKQHIDEYLQGKHSESNTAVNVDILIAINPQMATGKIKLTFVTVPNKKRRNRVVEHDSVSLYRRKSGILDCKKIDAKKYSCGKAGCSHERQRGLRPHCVKRIEGRKYRYSERIGFDNLKAVVPYFKDHPAPSKLPPSKTQILDQATNHVKFLEKQQMSLFEELKELRHINDSLHRQLMELHQEGNNETFSYSLKEDLDKMYEIKIEKDVE